MVVPVGGTPRGGRHVSAEDAFRFEEVGKYDYNVVVD